MSAPVHRLGVQGRRCTCLRCSLCAAPATIVLQVPPGLIAARAVGGVVAGSEAPLLLRWCGLVNVVLTRFHCTIPKPGKYGTLAQMIQATGATGSANVDDWQMPHSSEQAT